MQPLILNVVSLLINPLIPGGSLLMSKIQSLAGERDNTGITVSLMCPNKI